MFDEMGKSIDAIMVATPRPYTCRRDRTRNHARQALLYAKTTYPLRFTNRVCFYQTGEEISKVATQMGNQGNSFDWYQQDRRSGYEYRRNR